MKKTGRKIVDAGKAAYLIDFPEVEYERYPDKHKEYIHLGEVMERMKGISVLLEIGGIEFHLCGCQMRFF